MRLVGGAADAVRTHPFLPPAPTPQAGIRIRRALFYGKVLGSRFTLSPPGNGIDTYRTWEAMYMGRVPIVDSTLPAFLYEDLPCLVVDSWFEVTPARLNATWAAMHRHAPGYNLDKLWAPWWLLYMIRHCLVVP